MSEYVATREIDPFSFWPHRSAIVGLGGPDRGPDPNYCFHTLYYEYRTGIVIFKVTLLGAKASYGELAIRAHAFQPDSGRNASLVAGSRTPLNQLTGSNLEINIRVGAVPGVQYALFGYFSESSDLQATGVSILVEEQGGANPDDYITPDETRSLFEVALVDLPNRLMADNLPSFAHPVSQALTVSQIESVEYARSWSEIPITPGDEAMRWRQTYALQVLETYRMLQSGASGLLMASGPLALSAVIRARGAFLTDIRIRTNSETHPSKGGGFDQHISSMTLADIETRGEQVDFVVSIIAADWFASRDEFFSFVNAAIRRILRGGLGVFVFDYLISNHNLSDIPDIFVPNRGEIEQLAIKIISHGSDVAQLSFGEGADTYPVIPRCPFGLIVRR